MYVRFMHVAGYSILGRHWELICSCSSVSQASHPKGPKVLFWGTLPQIMIIIIVIPNIFGWLSKVGSLFGYPKY